MSNGGATPKWPASTACSSTGTPDEPTPVPAPVVLSDPRRRDPAHVWWPILHGVIRTRPRRRRSHASIWRPEGRRLRTDGQQAALPENSSASA
jgi:hypothetical protein